MAARTLPGLAVSPDEARAATLAALVGGLVVGLQLEGTGRAVGIADFGRLVGLGYSAGWVVLLAASVGLTMLFVAGLARTLDAFVTHVVVVSNQHERLQDLLLPLLSRSPMTVTAAGLGLGYGVVVAVGFYALLVPAGLRLATEANVPLPNLSLVGTLVWVLYGLVVGGVYGYALER